MKRSSSIRSLVAFIAVQTLLSTALAEPVCVTSPRANLRRGPGTQHSVSWTVSQHMPLMRLAKQGQWSQVQDLEGNKHWVASNVLSNKMSCAVVKTKTSRLRQGPGTKYPVAELGFADRYTPFRKVDREGPWILVQDEFKGRYWVNEMNVWMPVNRMQVLF